MDQGTAGPDRLANEGSGCRAFALGGLVHGVRLDREVSSRRGFLPPDGADALNPEDGTRWVLCREFAQRREHLLTSAGLRREHVERASPSVGVDQPFRYRRIPEWLGHVRKCGHGVGHGRACPDGIPPGGIVLGRHEWAEQLDDNAIAGVVDDHPRDELVNDGPATQSVLRVRRRVLSKDIRDLQRNGRRTRLATAQLRVELELTPNVGDLRVDQL